ncbi:hypothetical protein Ddc_14235 [Ditylenchus destructor]|nr:hypothetical protein Ddc_14235 [Ditylenchus destructor]
MKTTALIKLKDTILVSGPCLYPEHKAKARQKRELRAYFRHFGKVIRIILSKDFNKSTVTFDNSDSAMKCIEQGIHKIQGQDFLVRRGRFSNAMKMKLGAILDKTMPLSSKQSVTIPNNQIEPPAVMTKRIFVSGPCLHPEKMDPIASQMEEFYMYFGHFGEIVDMSIKNDSYVIIFDNNDSDNYDECIQQEKHKICGQDFLVRTAAIKLKDTILVVGPCLYPEYNAKARQKQALLAYFDHFGKVIKIILSKNFIKSTVTFDNSDSAMECIERGMHKIRGQDFLVRRGRFSNAMKMKLGANPDETMPLSSKHDECIQQSKHKICDQDFRVRAAAPKKRQKKKQHKKIIKKRLGANQERNMLGSSHENVSASNVQNNPPAKSNFGIQVSQSKTSSSSLVHGSVMDCSTNATFDNGTLLRRSARLARKTKLENEIHGEPKAKKGRSENRVLNIAAFDDDTLLEAFKYLKYCGLAKISIVSKRYRDLIQRNRHSLALLYVESVYIYTKRTNPDFARTNSNGKRIKMFGEELSSETYDEWVIRNQYSKQVPFESQVAGMESTQHNGDWYRLFAEADEDQDYTYAYPKQDDTATYSALAKLNHDNWPIFQHFACLLSDPFICIQSMTLGTGNDVLNILAEVITLSNRDRLQCKDLSFKLYGNTHKFINWIKDHVCCGTIFIKHHGKTKASNHDAGLLDLFLKGAHCASTIYFDSSLDISNVFVDFVKTFMNLKTCDEYNHVQSIFSLIKLESVEEIDDNYHEFIIQVDEDRVLLPDIVNQFGGAWQALPYVVFEFVNKDIGKKLKFTAELIGNSHYYHGRHMSITYYYPDPTSVIV